MTRRNAFISFLCLFLLFLVREVYAQGYVFGPNVRVSDYPAGSAYSYTPNAGQRGIAVRGDTVYCVWDDDRTFDWGVWFAKSIDGGQTFLPNVQVDDGLGNAYTPTLAVGDDGTIYVAWTDKRPGYSYKQVYFSKSTDGGLTFTPDVVVNDTAGGIKNHPHRNPSMAVDSIGIIFIAFDDARNGRYDIYFSKSTDGGETFLPDVMVNDSLPGNTSSRLYPGLTADNSGNVYVVWEDPRHHSWPDIYFSMSTDGGMTFLPDVAASDTDSCLYRVVPSVNVDGRGYIHVVWMQFDSNSNIFYSRSINSGLTFGQSILVNDSLHEPDPQSHPSMCVDDSGIVYAVWEEGPASYSDIFFTLSTDNSDSAFVEPNVEVDDTDSLCAYPSVAVGNSSNVYVLWLDFRNGFVTNDVFFSVGKYEQGVKEVKNREERVSISTLFPNPFSDKTVIEFRSSRVGISTPITLKVYDISGRLVKTLINEFKGLGVHMVVWDGRNEKNIPVLSGVYFVKGWVGKKEVNEKVIYLR